jgi:beta-xylosidase
LAQTIFALLLLAACAMPGGVAAQQPRPFANPVIAGDFPDPSVIRVRSDYWATTTSGEWAPLFPLLHSRDLVSWEVAGAVFHQRPSWAERDFWAPEIVEDRGRFFVFYTARKKGGPLCVAVATAAQAAGPYTDRGPLVCQSMGSIDAATVRDENGQFYLLWKEDGNSRSQPTRLWAQPLAEDGTKLTGAKKELFHNDAPWEGGVVEGPFVVRRGEWFYMFYSGNACCGRSCNYALGVARARKLLGPWEKNPANPILAANDAWQCPGHGSIVEDEQGRSFLLYHSYKRSEDFVQIGREAMLDEVEWSTSGAGWPTINSGKGPGRGRALSGGAALSTSVEKFFDDFDSLRTSAGWQWPYDNEPVIRLEKEGSGFLLLAPQSGHASDLAGAVIARPTTTGDYSATAVVDVRAMTSGARAGLAAYQDNRHALGIAVGDGKVTVWLREGKEQKTVATANAPSSQTVHLRLTAREGYLFRFAVSADGRDWKDVGEQVNGSHLEAVRIALTAGGASGAVAKFDSFSTTPIERDARSSYYPAALYGLHKTGLTQYALAQYANAER